MEEIKIDASNVENCCNNGDPIENLEVKLGEMIETMKVKDGPQELRLTVIINNDLEIEDEESEDEESADESGLEKET